MFQASTCVVLLRRPASTMDYDQSGEQMAAHAEHLHPALQDSEEPGAKRQRLNGEAPATEGVEQQVPDLQVQVRAWLTLTTR